MKKSYLNRKDLAKIDVRFAFKAGDQVLHRQRRLGKLEAKAMGPYRFVEYHGGDKVTATIADQYGKARRCSVANLVPMRLE